MTVPERLVFDAEPLIAHADEEPGSDDVETYLSAVLDSDATGFVHHVTLTEIRYVIARKYGPDVADEYLDWVLAIGVTPIGAEMTWKRAADFVLDCNPALGDAYALATAQDLDATLLVGADDDYDCVSDVAIERFRTEPA